MFLLFLHSSSRGTTLTFGVWEIQWLWPPWSLLSDQQVRAGAVFRELKELQPAAKESRESKDLN